MAVGLVAVAWPTVHASALLPLLSLTSVTDGLVVSGVVPLSVQASAAGFSSLQFQVSGQNVGTTITSGACSTSWDTRAMPNGVHTVTAVARDSAGNAVWAPPALVTVLNLGSADTTSPTVTLTAPSNGASVTGTITLSATSVDNVGVTGIWFTLDGATIGTEVSSPQATVSWNSVSTANGTHRIAAAARDAAGNTAVSSAVTITVNNAVTDTTAPSVSLTAPAAGAALTGSVTLTASASDNIGVASVQFTVDGFAVGSADSSTPYQATWNTATSSNGSHVIRAVARDAAGNTTTSGARTVTVSNVSDNAAPSVSLTAPAAGTTVSGTIAVSATASDNVGVKQVQFTLDGAALGPPDTASPYQATWATTGTSNGVHVLRAVATDAAGNSTTSGSRTVTVGNAVDTSAPTITVTSPAPGAGVSGTVTITANASGPSGVASVQFAIDGEEIATDTSSPYRATWSTTRGLNGTHTITAVARDSVGRTRMAPPVQVTVRNLGSGVAGDFNDDGQADLLFRHPSGQLYVWLMDGAELQRATAVTPAGADPLWKVVSTDDFNGDRKTDILWQHSVTGQVYVWYMDGTTMIGGDYLPFASPDWNVAATGDLNGDGKPDIVLQHPQTGQLFGLFLDGITAAGYGPLSPGSAGPGWQIAGMADLDRDGHSDLVWQNFVDGSIYIWYMNGLDAVRGENPTPGATVPAWQIKGVADHNRDGRPDLIWEHATTGQLYLWTLKGSVMVNDRFLAPGQVNVAWQIVGGK
jgi:hypothetical protein